MSTVTTVSTKEAADQAGCSYRQLDYWIRTGAIPPTMGTLDPGSGNYRQIPEWYIPRLRVIARIQAVWGKRSGMPGDVLRRVFDQYDYGVVEFDGGIRITWEVE